MNPWHRYHMYELVSRDASYLKRAMVQPQCFRNYGVHRLIVHFWLYL